MLEQDFTDAIALLKADHRKVEQLFAAFERRRASPQGEAGAEICTELKIHTCSRRRFSIRPSAARSRTTCSTRPMSSMTAPRC